jgi:hypothetical protein
MIEDGPRTSMRPHHRCLTDSNRIPHRLITRMRQVDQDTQPIQLLHELEPKLREPIPMLTLRHRAPRAITRGERRMARMRQREVPHSHLGKQPHGTERVPQEVRALHADQAGDAARVEGAPYIGRRARVLHVLGMLRNHVLDDIEDLERIAQAVVTAQEVRAGVLAREVGARRPDAEEGAAQVPGPHLGDVDVAREGGGQVGEDVERPATCLSVRTGTRAVGMGMALHLDCG